MWKCQVWVGMSKLSRSYMKLNVSETVANIAKPKFLRKGAELRPTSLRKGAELRPKSPRKGDRTQTKRMSGQGTNHSPQYATVGLGFNKLLL